MIHEHLGTTIDIHGGGRDLIFPHHENEIAQSRCAHGGDYVRYWVHNAYLDIDGEKMSKSLGNFRTVHDLLQSYRGEVLRFALLSAHYRSPLNFSAELLEQAEATLTSLYSTLREVQDIELDMEIPQAVMVSAYHEFTDKLTVMGNVGWQDWSGFGNIDVSINSDTSTNATQDLGYDDTWHFALGLQYRIAAPWLFSAGVAYDTSPADSGKKRTPALPLDRQMRAGAGVQYELNQDVTLGVAYEYLDLGDGNINLKGGNLRGDLKGDYQENHIHFIGLNVVWKF